FALGPTESRNACESTAGAVVVLEKSIRPRVTRAAAAAEPARIQGRTRRRATRTGGGTSSISGFASTASGGGVERGGFLAAAELRLLLHFGQEVVLERVERVGAQDREDRDGDLLVFGVVAEQDLEGHLDLLLVGQLADEVGVGAELGLELGHAGLVELAGQERVDELFVRHAFSVAILSWTQSFSWR